MYIIIIYLHIGKRFILRFPVQRPVRELARPTYVRIGIHVQGMVTSAVGIPTHSPIIYHSIVDDHKNVYKRQMVVNC